ncbi:MAG: potassium channel family protein [Chloroflexota bacterium]
MQILIMLIGLALIFIILWDAFETVVLPRRITRQWRLTSMFYRLTWSPWSAVARKKSERDRENFLGLYGPLSLLLLLGVWAIGLIFGFGLLHWGASFSSGEEASLIHYLYFSGTNFFTLGLGDVVPLTPLGRIITVGEAGTGFAFLGLVVAYVPLLYQAFSRREVNISLLDARAGSPPSAIELLQRFCQVTQSTHLDSFFADWERWSAEVLESHMSYPVLGYFRSQHENESWLAALTMVLDASALVIATFDGATGQAANLTFAMARHAAVDLSQVYATPPHVPMRDRLRPAELALAQNLFATRHQRINVDRLMELRRLYEPYVNALADYLLMPLPTWSEAPNVSDNWQITAWSQVDGIALERPISIPEPASSIEK